MQELINELKEENSLLYEKDNSTEDAFAWASTSLRIQYNDEMIIRLQDKLKLSKANIHYDFNK